MERDQLAQLPGLLLPWYEKNARPLPWRQDREPYHVWLSEIMLQQTRVEAVKGYYARFLAALPRVEDLARADGETVNKLWEGLGYYSRARNLHRAAQAIMEQYGGVFPRDYDKIRALPGIGDYTAGAICSIAFDLPTPAVDGNVLRVISRLTASRACVSELSTKRLIRQQLAEVYPEGRCGDFTQSLMELGATVCLPNGTPSCENCPVKCICKAQEGELWRQLPVLAAKKNRRQADKTVFILQCEDKLALLKRPEKGLLAGLWQLPEAEGELSAAEALALAEQWGVCPKDLLRQAKKEHIFTHVQWHMTGYYLQCGARPPQFTWVSREELEGAYSIPTAFKQFL